MTAVMGLGARARRSLRIRRSVFVSHEHRAAAADHSARQFQYHHDATRRPLSLSLSSSVSVYNEGDAARGGMWGSASQRNSRTGSSTPSTRRGAGDGRRASTHTAGEASPGAAPVPVSMDDLLALASRQPTALSLGAMYRYAPKRDRGRAPPADGDGGQFQFVDVSRLRNAQFLHREVPVRIAQRAVDLLTLPRGLSRTREVQAVADAYLRYLQQLRDFPVPTNEESERAFTDLLRGLVLDRHAIPMALSAGLQSLQDDRRAPPDKRKMAEMEEGLHRFFTARVGLRFLVEHHVLSGDDADPDALLRQRLEAEGGTELLDDEALAPAPPRDDGDRCGAIQKHCDPVREARRSAARVAKLCRESYGIAPEIDVVDCTPEEDAGQPFTYVPHHLRYMLRELLKNSCRATVESYLSGANMQKEDHTNHHSDPDGGIHDAPTLPPIKVIVTKGKEDVTIKIADRGGGMPRSVTNRIWSFAQSTLGKRDPATRPDDRGPGGAPRDEIAGDHLRGFGLPLARIYARYFGGEITVRSMEGYGVDAYLYLPVLGVACENLPPRVVRSPGNLASSAAGGDDDGDDPPAGVGAGDVAAPGAGDEAGRGSGDARFFEGSEVRASDAGRVTTRSAAALDALDERAL